MGSWPKQLVIATSIERKAFARAAGCCFGVLDLSGGITKYAGATAPRRTFNLTCLGHRSLIFYYTW